MVPYVAMLSCMLPACHNVVASLSAVLNCVLELPLQVSVLIAPLDHLMDLVTEVRAH
jgi:hypothetical protein